VPAHSGPAQNPGFSLIVHGRTSVPHAHPVGRASLSSRSTLHLTCMNLDSQTVTTGACAGLAPRARHMWRRSSGPGSKAKPQAGRPGRACAGALERVQGRLVAARREHAPLQPQALQRVHRAEAAPDHAWRMQRTHWQGRLLRLCLMFPACWAGGRSRLQRQTGTPAAERLTAKQPGARRCCRRSRWSRRSSHPPRTSAST